MAKIECLMCENWVEIPKFVNMGNYDGQIVCKQCKALLSVKFVGSELRKYKLVSGKGKGDVPVGIVYKQTKDKGKKQNSYGYGEFSGFVDKGFKMVR